MSAIKTELENMAERIAMETDLYFEDVMDVYDIYQPADEAEWLKFATNIAKNHRGRYVWGVHPED